MTKVFFHVDLDAFFASVEQLEHKEYRGHPVIVGGMPGDRRAVVSTASYEARKFGVHSAMPLEKAIKLCPNAIYLRPNFKLYHKKSQQVMDIFSKYSPTVIQISVDEAFLDMTGTERLFGAARDVAIKLKNQILNETGLTVSIGIASTMYIAKIASGLNKPNGLTYVPFGEEERFMLSLPLKKLWSVGDKTQEKLCYAGIRTTKDIYDMSKENLRYMFGNSMGDFLYNAVRGNKNLTFGADPKNHSVSSETTFDFDLYDEYTMESFLMELSQNVLFRMYEENVRSSTVALKIRYSDFTTVSIQSTEDSPIANADDIFSRCCRLFEKKYEKGRGVRLLGVSCENTEDKNIPLQGELFDLGNSKKAKVEEAIYNLEQKMQGVKIQKARLLSK